MSREGTGQPSLDAFRRAYMAGNEAFNSHDFENAFFGFHPDFEWHTIAYAPGVFAGRGREGVIEAFRALLEEFPDWHVEPLEFEESDRAILVRNLATGTGRQSGAKMRQRFTQVWEFREGRAWRVREYFDHSEAREATGLPE
jgi:ketosteroid isomerase-like protein